MKSPVRKSKYYWNYDTDVGKNKNKIEVRRKIDRKKENILKNKFTQ